MNNYWVSGVLVVGALAGALPVWATTPEKKAEVRVLVSAEGESVLAAQMAGRIVAINAKLGERIKKGDVLLHFDCDEQEARLNMAKAELNGSQHVLEAKNTLKEM